MQALSAGPARQCRRESCSKSGIDRRWWRRWRTIIHSPKRRTIGIGDLRDQPLIMYPRDSGIGLYWQVIRLCAAAGFRPQIVREVQELTTIVGLVDAGVGIAIVPADTRSIHLPGVAYVPLARQGCLLDALSCFSRARSQRPSARVIGRIARSAGDPQNHGAAVSREKFPAPPTRIWSVWPVWLKSRWEVPVGTNATSDRRIAK